MAFDSDFIDEIKFKVNIVDVVGKEVHLKKSGSNYVGLCPFHSEKTPSFNVNEEKQIFNCFGCGQKGDVITFVQKYHNLSFMEACEKLCNENGIKMPERKSRGPKIDYERLYEINKIAARFFFDNLTKTKNKGYAYIKKRGISDETIVKFGLGYAPNNPYSLVNFLRSKGVSDNDMLKLSLANQGKNGIYDKFRDRLIFPIFNTTGNVIGFGGRALGDYKPKYLNSAESDIFLKKNNLYGLNFTKKYITDRNQAIIVEGYMDVISLYQAGVKNVAASLGTALTENQARLLCRYSKNIILSYDSDKAGISAAVRGIDVVNSAGGRPKVLNISDGKDPDEFMKSHSSEDFYKLVKNAVYATDFKLKVLREGYDFSNRLHVLDYLKKCEPVLSSLGPVEQDIYIKKLAEEFNISEKSIAIEVHSEETKSKTNVSNQRAAYTNNRRSQKNFDRNLKIELSLAILCMYNVNYLKRISEDGIVFESALGKKVLKIIKELVDDGSAASGRIEEKDLYNALEPDEEDIFRKYLESIKLGPDDEAFYNECRSSYRLGSFKERKLEIQNGISVAESLGDTKRVNELVVDLMKIDNIINHLMEEQYD